LIGGEKRSGKSPSSQISILEEIIVDNFAGGGGASTGMELATGRPVEVAINHDPDAILMHKTNHPYTRHFQASVWDIDPEKVCQGHPVGLAWFSPDCKHFSKAKGGKPVDKSIRGLAWIVLRWAGTVRPRVIILENVEEFQTWGPVRKGRPVKAKAGQTFEKFISQLRSLGYAVEWRELVAADYGAPTTRKRLFLIARCDGRPVVWPEPSHAPRNSEAVRSGRLKPWISAAEVIDWSLPCPSVFESKAEIKKKYGITAVRPLAEKTMRRAIRGVDRFTIKSGEPFLVQVNRSEHDDRIGASLIQYHTEQTEHVRGQELKDPIMTIDAANRYGLIGASLMKYYGNDDYGQEVGGPLHTVTAKDREGVLAANLSKFYGGIVGTSVKEPTPTVTAVDHNALTVAHMMELYGTGIGREAQEPVSTVTASGTHHAAVEVAIVPVEIGVSLGYWPEIRALLNKYCGYELKENEVLLLSIGGTRYFISDIGLRMLTPRELYAANGFPPDYIIDRDYAGNVYGKTKQVARCGNAVPPPFATAIVRANLPEWCEKRYKTMADFASAVAVLGGTAWKYCLI